jgi:hypothetical protein
MNVLIHDEQCDVLPRQLAQELEDQVHHERR